MESRIHGSKLSAAVPAFIPGATYTGVTSARLSNDLVINSDLSPLVPEFQPSGSCSFPLSTPHQPIHSLQYRTKQVYLKHEKIDLQENAPQVYQTTFLASKRFTAKIEKPATAKKGKRTCEAQNVSENTTSEQSAEISVNVSKKKRQRKKKESRDLIQQQGKEEKESYQSKDVSSSKEFDASLKANEVSKSKSSQSSCITLPSSSETSSGITGDKRTDITVIEHDQQPDKTQFAAPTFTVSYSDKVKSLSLKNSNTSNHTVTEKYWVKDFTSESSIKKDTGKPNDLKQSPKVRLVQNRRTLNLDNNQRTSEKSGHCGDALRKPPDSTWKKTWEDSEYYKLKSGDSFKSQTTSSKQIARTGKQMGRNSSFKKISCDDDDNWRVKKEAAHVVDSATSHRTEPIEKLNIKNLNDESFEKKTCQQEGILVGVDSKQYKKDVKQEKIVGRNVVDDKVETLRKQKNYCDLGSSLTEQTACTGFPVNKLGSDLPSSSQDHKANQILNASNVAASDHKIMEGEFPDLKESVKMKRPLPTTEERTINYKEMVTSPKPSAPMSYSAALRSAPQPKPVVVSPAWENEQPTTHGGLLKVPSQAMAREVGNEAGQGESTPKKKKKKKKKKKTSETGEQTQESGSSKRTQKPIKFDLGVMLQAISKSSSERGKKLVIATGVLPTQLSVISSTDAKHGVNNPQLKKGESKVPHNKLDSTAPVIKRGKERETPARKKPSALKKIILKEREEKKKAKETSETDDVDDDTCDGQENRTCESEGEMIAHQEVQSQSEDETADPEPLSPTDREIAAEIHSRRFREYCFQIPDKEVDTVATELLRELVRFQDRQFHKDPVKAKAKRRFVLGLREVNKHLKLRKLKCVIISSNVERIKSAGGLDDTLDNIISLCQENLVPVVFALKRQLLGKVLLKKVPVSIVGIFNYDGAQEHFKTLMELTQKTKQAYTDKWQETREKLELQQKETSDVIRNEMEMVSSAEINQADDILQTMSGDAGTENYFADDAESSDDDDDGDDGNNEESIDSDRYNEKETIMIVENDLEIQDL